MTQSQRMIGAQSFHFRRVGIEGEIEMHLARVDLLLARIDRADGDPDIEDDDPAGDLLDERGESPTDTGEERLLMHPLYGIDQTGGPINERAALRRRHIDSLRPTPSSMPTLRTMAGL